jgi:hypothetical protein
MSTLFFSRQAQNGPAQARQAGMKSISDRGIISLEILQNAVKAKFRSTWMLLETCMESHRLEYALKRPYSRVFRISSVGQDRVKTNV